MQWSREQEQALLSVQRWIASGSTDPYRLFGYAGVGKTTLAQYFAEGVDGQVLYGSFTGKAASVLRSKGCADAMTIHQMIYQVCSKSHHTLRQLEEDHMVAKGEEASEDTLRRLQVAIKQERENLKQPSFTVNPDAPAQHAALIIIDECSMVNERMGQDLLSFNVPVLVLGDPAQLPPVFGGGFFTNQKPDTMLTEIHRQARDNPIIELATRVRQGKTLEYGDYGESRVVNKAGPEDATGADQVLVGLNKTRRKCIGRLRELLEFDGPIPLIGERVVCLRNDHDVGLLNGTIWGVESIDEVDGHDQIGMTLTSEDSGDTVDVVAHRHHFEGREKELCTWTRRDAQEFDFAYALTTHKAQGSQWKKVLVFDESYAFRGSRNKWLYTAITRAAEKVVIVRK